MQIAVLAGLLSLATLAAQQPALDQLPPAAREQTRDGAFTSWFANGRVREHGPVDEQGRLQGDCVLRHPNGRTAASGVCRDGRREGHWTWFDQYGRAERMVSYQGGTVVQDTRIGTGLHVPLGFADLRLTLVGERTLGEVLDECRPAPDAAALERLLIVLAPLGTFPAVLVYEEVERAAEPAHRVAWLQLLAKLELPDDQPSGWLQHWQWDPRYRAAARAVLERWSQRFRDQWQPMVTNEERDSELGAMGLKAYGSLPLVRQRLEQRDLGAPSLLRAILGESCMAMPVLKQNLHSSDRELRLQSLALCSMLWSRMEGLPKVLLRLLDDPDQTIAFWAATGIASDHYSPPESYDAHLHMLAGSPHPELRLRAASRLLQLGRNGQALPLLRDLVQKAPGYCGQCAVMQLVRVTDDRIADREMLFALHQGGRSELRGALGELADDDLRIGELMTAAALLSKWPSDVEQLQRLPRSQWPQLRQRLQSAFDGEAASPVRLQAFAGLWALTESSAREPLLLRALDDREPTIRARGMALLADATLPGLPWERMLAMLLDDAPSGDLPVRQQALQALNSHKLPDGFDARRLYPLAEQVPATVLATWAEGSDYRIGLLVDWALKGGLPWQAAPALALLRPDLRPHAELIREKVLGNPNVVVNSAMIDLLPADEAQRLRIRRMLLQGTRLPATGPGTDPQGGITVRDDALLPLVAKALTDPDGRIATAALRLLPAFGDAAAGAVDAIVAALPTMPVDVLREVPGVVLTIAPHRATSVCLRLLEHREKVVRLNAAAPLVVSGSESGDVPADADFTRRLVAVMRDSDEWYAGPFWFHRLADHGRSALPELIAGLVAEPRHFGLALALGEIGPHAAIARTELTAALAAGNGRAAIALGRVLPCDAAVRDLLVASTRVDAVAHDAVNGLELMSLDDPEVSKALRALVESGRRDLAALAATALCRRGGTDAASLAGLLAWWRRDDVTEREEVDQLFTDAQVLALLPQLTPLEREQRLVRQLQMVPWLRGRFAHPDLVAAAANLVDQAIDRDALLLALAVAVPGHPMLAPLTWCHERSWNRGCHWTPRLAAEPQLLLQHWLDGRFEGKERAALLVALRSDGAQTLAALWPSFDHPLAARRAAAMTLLAELGEAGRPAFARAVAALQDDHWDVRKAAMHAIATTAPDEAAAVKILADYARQHAMHGYFGVDPQMPVAVNRALLQAGSPDDGTDPFVMIELRAPDDAIARMRAAAGDEGTRWRWLPAAGTLGDRAIGLLPELRACLSSPSVEHRITAIDLLGRLGPAAATAIPDLEAQQEIPACRFPSRRAIALIRGGVPQQTR